MPGPLGSVYLAWFSGLRYPGLPSVSSGTGAGVVELPAVGLRLRLGAVLRHTRSNWTPFVGRIVRRSVLEVPRIHPG